MAFCLFVLVLTKKPYLVTSGGMEATSAPPVKQHLLDFQPFCPLQAALSRRLWRLTASTAPVICGLSVISYHIWPVCLLLHVQDD